MSNPPPLSPQDISTLSTKYFSPRFRPLRAVRQPTPPRLAWSPLPPPAEIDERPSGRIRRFRLWDEVGPGLRRCVLDPKKRFHLRRYQSFATPNSPHNTYRRPRPLPFPASFHTRTVRDREEGWDWSTPVRVPQAVLAPDEEYKASTLALQTCRGAIVRGERGLITPPPSAGEITPAVIHIEDVARNDERPPSPRLTPFVSPEPSRVWTPGTPGASTAHSGGPLSATEGFVGPIIPTIPPQPAAIMTPSIIAPRAVPPMRRLPPPWTDKSIPKRQRKVAWDQLLEHRWVLDQEQERRFRNGMRRLMDEQMDWQANNTLPYPEWKNGRKWKDGVDLAEVETGIAFFKAIRKKSANIYNYFDDEVLAPVPGRQEAQDLVEEEEERRKVRWEKKAAKRAMAAQAGSEAQGAATAGVGSAGIGGDDAVVGGPVDVPTTQALNGGTDVDSLGPEGRGPSSSGDVVPAESKSKSPLRSQKHKTGNDQGSESSEPNDEQSILGQGDPNTPQLHQHQGRPQQRQRALSSSALASDAAASGGYGDDLLANPEVVGLMARLLQLRRTRVELQAKLDDRQPASDASCTEPVPRTKEVEIEVSSDPVDVSESTRGKDGAEVDVQTASSDSLLCDSHVGLQQDAPETFDMADPAAHARRVLDDLLLSRKRENIETDYCVASSHFLGEPASGALPKSTASCDEGAQDQALFPRPTRPPDHTTVSPCPDPQNAALPIRKSAFADMQTCGSPEQASPGDGSQVRFGSLNMDDDTAIPLLSMDSDHPEMYARDATDSEDGDDGRTMTAFSLSGESDSSYESPSVAADIEDESVGTGGFTATPRLGEDDEGTQVTLVPPFNGKGKVRARLALV